MNKIFFKFSLSLVLLLNTAIFVLFFPELVYLVEDYLYPLFFVYFIIDSIGVMIPKFNDSIYSSKMQKRVYIAVENYNEDKLHKYAKENNLKALIIAVSYTFMITLIGFAFLYFEWFEKMHLYLVFFAINFADYFCIMLWCPFRVIFLKNSCCNTCRISNWDRIMKFGILVFIPNIYTISIFILGVSIFLYWEYHHWKHPERFYRISNQTLWCTNCDKITCGKKYTNKDKKE